MNRREILKFLAAVPIASALGGCRQDQAAPQPVGAPLPSPTVAQTKGIHTLQVLFEGAFALVLQKNNPNKLTAFVPRIDMDKELEHDFFFNDPTMPKIALEKEHAGYTFQLSGDGLRPYPETYINPGLADFTAETEKWRLSDRVVTVELPFPSSINFSGHPLKVKFASGRSGLMATNYMLEYYVDDADKIKLMCSQLGDKCTPSPNCPPGIIRYFFGVSPHLKNVGPEHAIKFFNAMLHTSFPDLEARYKLAYIEPAEKLRDMQDSKAGVKPTVFNADMPPARLVRTSAILDCQFIGLIVKTHSGPSGA